MKTLQKNQEGRKGRNQDCPYKKEFLEKMRKKKSDKKIYRTLEDIVEIYGRYGCNGNFYNSNYAKSSEKKTLKEYEKKVNAGTKRLQERYITPCIRHLQVESAGLAVDLKKIKENIEDNNMPLDDIPSIIMKISHAEEINIELVKYFYKKRKFGNAINHVNKIINCDEIMKELLERCGLDSKEVYKSSLNITKQMHSWGDKFYSQWENPRVYELDKQLKKAVSNENYEEAAKIRDKINNLTSLKGLGIKD